MGREPYECSNCKRTFSREWNAERHNINVHNEMAIIFNKDAGRILNKKKESKSLSPSPFPSSSNTTTTDTKNINKTIIPSSPNPYPDILKDFNVGITYPEINKNTADEDKFFKIFEKISPLIDELDTQLSAYKSHEDRIKFLSEVIIFALMSSNPVHSLKDMINLHRSTMGIKKASGFVALTHKIPLDQAQLMLKTIILAAPYSKNKFNK